MPSIKHISDTNVYFPLMIHKKVIVVLIDNVLNCKIIVSEFELVALTFGKMPFGKGMNPFILDALN